VENESKAHILVVDDDSRILELLKQFLSQNNYLVSIATSAKEAEILLKEFIFDLMIVDVMMPEITGIEFAKKIKDHKLKVPIILLTALSEPEDKVKGLESGADDYVTKPFDGKELLLRVKNLIQLYGNHQQNYNFIRFGNIIYDTEKRNLYNNIKEKDIKLSSTEKKLLEILIQHKGEILARERLSNMMGDLNERSIDVQIVRLRSKVEDNPKEPKFIQTARNEGYILYI
jgi:two-component system phosphate regulon response regulator OmpR